MVSKTLLNQCSIGRTLSDDELSKLKKTLLSILVDIDFVCKKHGFHYYLAWGSLLGAVRHDGFIPWDDDVDLFMPILEMDSFRKAMIGDFGGKYFFGGLFPQDGTDPNCQMKVMLSGTKYTEIQNTSVPFPRGIGVDVFPIIAMPRSRFGRKVRYRRGLFLLHVVGVEIEFHYPPNCLLHNLNKSVRRYYRFRRMIGFCFSAFSLMKWKKKYLSFCLRQFGNSEYIAFCPDMNYLFNGSAAKKSFLDQRIYSFEKHDFVSLADYDGFLKAAYGDYMKLPDKNHQEKHIIADILFL